MSETTPYTTPNATVADPGGEYGQINVFSFAGRLGRLRYFVYTIGVLFVGMLLMGILGGGAAMMTGGADPQTMSGAAVGIMVILYLAILVIMIMLGIQRLHDLDKTGWLLLLNIIPFINVFFALYLLFARGTLGPNRYGNPPPPNSTGVVVAAWIVGILYFGMVIGSVMFSASMTAGNMGTY